MTISTFSLPVDIPWRRIAFSSDMMDKTACDRALPPRWRSSVAVFDYEPPDEQQLIDGYTVSYLKVACSITGYQADGKEIRIRERLARSGWGHSDIRGLSTFLTDAIDEYYACYGAILEVVVAPPEDVDVTFEDYPYFADFDPKKRELYEQVTDTGEVMSRSLEDVGVRLGQTTSQSHEVHDSTTLGAQASGEAYGVKLQGNYSNTSGTTDVNQRASENIRTTDAARESRETLSHTTQLSQMYHQLNSYHLGSNRAAFFMLPRPHVVQAEDKDGTPRTFVDGPRQLEGVQEVMLVVVRPRSQEHMCVEAYLETAHLRRTPRLAPSTVHVLGPVKLEAPAPALDDTGAHTDVPRDNPTYLNWVRTYYKSEVYPSDGAQVMIDTSRGAGRDAATGQVGGFDEIARTVTPFQAVEKYGSVTVDYDVSPTSVTMRLSATGRRGVPGAPLGPKREVPASVEVTASVYLKSGAITAYDDALMITGRAVCSCAIGHDFRAHLEGGHGIVYENPKLHGGATVTESGSMAIRDANRLGAQIHAEMLRSLSSADRYPRDTVGPLDAQFVSDALAAHLRSEARELDVPIASIDVDERLRHRVTSHAPSMTRADLLELPLAEQVERFGLSFSEAVELRRALVGLGDVSGPRPVPDRLTITVPMLGGLGLGEVHGVLATAGLVLSEVVEGDSAAPSGSVIGQDPAAGSSVLAGSPVAVTIASGRSVRLPDVVGLGLAEASCRIREAGLRREPAIDAEAGSGRRVVVGLDPAAGTLVTPAAEITLRLGPSADRR